MEFESHNTWSIPFDFYRRELIGTYFSIKFVNPDGTKEIDTYDDLKIVPESRPLVNPPEVKTEYIDIPGADGSLDYTEALAGLKFKDREGSWVFYVLNDLFTLNKSYRKWNELYTYILKNIHGRRKKILLESDPGFYYFGRVFVSQWASNKDYSKLTLNYIIEPWKHPLETTASYDWLWNELFANTILYGKFDVERQKYRNLINPSDNPIEPTFTCTSPMTVIFGTSSYDLPSGTSTPGFKILPGDNFMVFNGNGRVTVDYSIGRQL